MYCIFRYYKDNLVTDLPLLERKKLLQKTVKEMDRFAISRYIENKGKALYQVAESQKLEGIVAKDKKSIKINSKPYKCTF